MIVKLENDCDLTKTPEEGNQTVTLYKEKVNLVKDCVSETRLLERLNTDGDIFRYGDLEGRVD